MPPRILLPLRLKPVNASSATASITSAFRSFSSTTSLCKKQSLAARYRDPYIRAQVLAAKAANISRQNELQEERQKFIGDPVRGVETPFVRSFDTGLPAQQTVTNSMLSSKTTAKDPSQPPPGPQATQEPLLNHFLSIYQVMKSFKSSASLAEPSAERRARAEQLKYSDTTGTVQRDSAYDANAVESPEETERKRKNAELAIQRIVSLRNGSSKDRTLANVRTCVETFGRHYTDLVLSPKPASSHAANNKVTVPVVSDAAAGTKHTKTQPLNPEWNTRGGPDTGSSEVQIAILTAKIRTLVKHMEGNGRKDKMNKRNLRLMVHKRQKHLKYLRKKERGGPRWQYVVEKLGVIDSMWKGEISL